MDGRAVRADPGVVHPLAKGSPWSPEETVVLVPDGPVWAPGSTGVPTGILVMTTGDDVPPGSLAGSDVGLDGSPCEPSTWEVEPVCPGGGALDVTVAGSALKKTTVI